MPPMAERKGEPLRLPYSGGTISRLSMLRQIPEKLSTGWPLLVADRLASGQKGKPLCRPASWMAG